MITYLLLVPFIGLVILGFHAVTRKGMLLSALGSDSSTKAEIEAIEQSLQEDLLELQQSYYFDFMDMCENGIDTTSLSSEYAKAYERRAAMYQEEMGRLMENGAKYRVYALSKPFSECTTCMSSFWSALILASFWFNQDLLFVFVPLAVAGIIQLFEAIKQLPKA